MKYRTKRITVDAYCLTEDVEVTAPPWLASLINNDSAYIDRKLIDGTAIIYGMTIFAQTGRLKARIGDFIIHGPNGIIAICKKKNFEALYERAE